MPGGSGAAARLHSVIMLRDGPWVVTALDETRARIFKDVSGHEEYREGVSLAALADGFDYTTLPQRVALLDTRGIAGGFTKFGTGLVGSAKQAWLRDGHPTFLVALVIASGRATVLCSADLVALPLVMRERVRAPNARATALRAANASRGERDLGPSRARGI